MRIRVPLVISLLLGSTAAMPVTPAAPASQMRTFHLDAPLTQVFPLFTARGERAWAPGWEPVLLSGAEERGSAFVTTGSHGRAVTWVVTDYRPAEGRVSYARLVHDSNIGLVDVVCSQAPHGGTDVSVRYTLTPLSDTGKEFVAEFMKDDSYSRMIDEWREATSKALGLPVH
jgi:hypothetical protein